MRKTLLSDRGNTLVLVLGLAMVIAIMVVPLVTMLSTSHRQAVMDAQYEKAHVKAESVALVFQKMLIADQDDLKSAQNIRDWASRLQNLNLCGSSRVVYDEANRLVTVSCTEGSGPVAKTAPVTFQLNYNASTSGGSGSGAGSVSNGTEFYQQFAVVTHNDVAYDKTYCVAPNAQTTPVKIDTSKISHTYNATNYSAEFNKLIDYYVGANLTTRLQTDRPAILTPASPTGAPTGAYTYGNGVTGYPTLSGDLKRNGDITINVTSGTTVRINGDVISSGKVTVYVGGNGSKLIITGKLHAQSIVFQNSGSDLISIGRWSNESWSTGTVSGGDASSMVASDTITFEKGPTYIRVAGDVSAKTMNAVEASVTVNLKTGGNVVTSSTLSFGRVNEWNIGGSLAAGGLISFSNSVDALKIGGSLYADKGFSFYNTLGNTGTDPTFTVGGSVLSGGNANFGNTTKYMNIGGDFIASGSFSAGNTVENIKIGGSLVSAGNIDFTNTSRKLDVGGSFLSGGSISFKAVYDGFNVDGLVGAAANIAMTGDLKPGYNEFGGFYAGGTATFPSWYQYSGNTDCAIIIGHNPPPAGGTGSSGPKLVFGSWSTN